MQTPIHALYIYIYDIRSQRVKTHYNQLLHTVSKFYMTRNRRYDLPRIIKGCQILLCYGYWILIDKYEI